jgi:hypothetical protein
MRNSFLRYAISWAVEVDYYEAYIEEADAIGRERYLKSGGGRRFLRMQLGHYLKTCPARSTA